MKMCKDCKWRQPDKETWQTPENQERYSVCTNPVFINPGNGLSLERCDWQRRAPWYFMPKCGPSGKLFEPKV